jgi:hypothetical protein
MVSNYEQFAGGEGVILSQGETGMSRDMGRGQAVTSLRETGLLLLRRVACIKIFPCLCYTMPNYQHLHEATHF